MGLSCSRNRASLSSSVRYWTAKSEPGEHASELQVGSGFQMIWVGVCVKCCKVGI